MCALQRDAHRRISFNAQLSDPAEQRVVKRRDRALCELTRDCFVDLHRSREQLLIDRRGVRARSRLRIVVVARFVHSYVRTVRAPPDHNGRAWPTGTLATREQITLRGPEAGMDEIAAAAGVAVGTLYRHFPTKTDLVAAVIAEYIAQVADDADAALERATSAARALDEISAFLQRDVEASASDRAVTAAADALRANPGDLDAEHRAGAALTELIRCAQADDDIHPDVTVADLYLLVTTAPTDRSEEDRARWLELPPPAITNRTP